MCTIFTFTDKVFTVFKPFFAAGLVLLLSIHLTLAQQTNPADTTKSAEGGTAATGAPDAAILAKGEELFNNNCTSCHALSNEVVVGPGLQGILERRDRSWLIPWIKNSQAVITSGDPYAVALYEKYNKTLMTAFPWPDEDINAVIDYIANYKPPVEPTTTSEGGTEVTAQSDSGLANYFNILLGILIVVLVLIVAVLFILVSLLRRYLDQKTDLDEADKEVIYQKYNFGKIFQSKAFINGVLIIFTLVVLKGLVDGMTDIGIQQGYAPTQPIAFSHKLHAGKYQIDCGYCHTGVYKGKSATIPSANICMNCHNAIKQNSPEIKKIYTAIENNKPIEWVRIHNLPDLAYFNHAQHTNVAGLACENCHGKIEEMEVVQQRAPLTMGWCINCHRQTVVEHAKDNAYYDRLMEYHSQNGTKPVTVENIGGLECSKCHY
ncbi:MAG: cytochrome c3 family protein [Microscillaceae bacterium]|nr:cytochrome c3 family protein [Microscillaceae bacterium]